MQRFNVSMDEFTISRLDDFAKLKKLSRSAVIRQAVLEYIDAQEQAPVVRSIMASFAEQTGAVISGKITSEEYQLSVDDLKDQMRQVTKKTE